MKIAKQIISSKTFKDTIVYMSGTALISVAQVFLVPMYTRILDPQAFGVMELLMTFINILTICITLGLPNAMFIFYFHENSYRRPHLALNLYYIYLIIATPIIIFLIIGSNLINQIIFDFTASRSLIVISILIAYFSVILQFYFNIIKAERKAWTYFFLNSIHAVFSTVLIITLVRNFELYGVFSPKLFISFIFAVLGTIYLIKNVKGKGSIKINMKRIKDYLSISLPLIPGILAAWLLGSGDRWILMKNGLMYDLGQYSLAYRFGTFFQTGIIFSFSAAYVPKIYAMYKENLLKAEQFNRKILKYYLLAGIPGMFLVIFAIQVFFSIAIGESYQEAMKYVPVILVSYFIYGAITLAQKIIHYQKKTMQLTMLTLIAAVFNISANIIFIPKFGAMAAAWTTLFSFLLLFFLMLKVRDSVCKNINP